MSHHMILSDTVRILPADVQYGKFFSLSTLIYIILYVKACCLVLARVESRMQILTSLETCINSRFLGWNDKFFSLLA